MGCVGVRFGIAAPDSLLRALLLVSAGLTDASLPDNASESPSEMLLAILPAASVSLARKPCAAGRAGMACFLTLPIPVADSAPDVELTVMGVADEEGELAIAIRKGEGSGSSPITADNLRSRSYPRL